MAANHDRNFVEARESLRPVTDGHRWTRVFGAMLVLLLLTLACVRERPWGEGPPRIDGKAIMLAPFGPRLGRGGGLDLAAVARAELPAPAILDVGPIGDTHPAADITLRFNRPMIPFGERSPVDPGLLTITPPIAGELDWEDPTRLVFRPKQPLPIATTHEVRFAGFGLARTWQFTTTRPQIDLWVGVDVRRLDREGRPRHHNRSEINLSSSQPLRREVLARHVRAAAFDDEGKAVPVAVEVREHPSTASDRWYFTIHPRDRWPTDREIVVTVDAELTGEAGPAKLGHDVVRSFRTTAGVSIDRVICVEGRHPDGCELGPVALALSWPIAKEQARHIRISPTPREFAAVAVDEREVPGLGGQWGDQRGYGKLLMWGDFERGVDYALTIDPALRDVYDQPYAGEHSETLRFVEPPPSLTVESGERILDLAGPTTIGIESRHVEQLGLTLAVLSEDEHERLLGHDFVRFGLPGDLGEVQRQRIHIKPDKAFGWTAHSLDLSRFTQGKPGVVAFEVRASALSQRANGREVPSPQFGLVQLTSLGVTVVGSVPGGVVRVARLRDDAPVAGASVELIDPTKSPDGERRLLGHTDAEGRLALPSSTTLHGFSLLRVRDGDDQVLLHISGLADAPGESVRIALTSDRPLYLPGDPLRVIGWAALSSPRERSGLRPLPEQTKVALRIRNPHGTVIAERTVTAKQHGKFWARFDLPTGLVGVHRIEATVLGGYAEHEVRVEDIQPPDFELSASTSTPDVRAGEAPQIDLRGTYLFGGRVPIDRVWHATACEGAWYRPPGLPEGFEVERVWRVRDEIFPAGELVQAQAREVNYALAPAPVVNGPLRCTHYVSATDTHARNMGTTVEFWLHPPIYLAIRTPDDVQAGDDATIEVRALLPDGSAAELDRAEITLSGYRREDDRPVEPQRCRARLVAGRGQCRLRMREPGQYWATAEAQVGERRLSADAWFYVDRPKAPETIDELTITAEGPRRVGEVGKFVVQAPWSSGRALLVLGKNGVHEVHELELVDGHGEHELELDDAWIPSVQAWVLAVEPGVPPRLHRAMERLWVESDSRELTVSIQAPSTAATRESIPIDVEVRDAAGRPVGGHVAIWAIDEAILALAPLELPSITAIFANHSRWDRSTTDFRSDYDRLLAPYQTRVDPYSPRIFDPSWVDAPVWPRSVSRIGKAKVDTSIDPPAPTLQVRSQFSSAPFFIADARLDENGRARVVGTLPDNLTTYRIVALASAPLLSNPRIEGRSGSADARVRVTRPLVVRAVVPRVLRPGDRAELGVVIDNLEGPAGVLELDVALHGGEGIAMLGGAARTRVSIPAGEQIRLPFELGARAVGEAILEVQARLDGLHDGLRVPLTIEPEPIAVDRAAIYGELPSRLDRGSSGSPMDTPGFRNYVRAARRGEVAMLPISLPADVDPRHGGLSVSIGGSMVHGLADAVTYLLDYPHECAEQTASRLLPAALLAGRDDISLGVDPTTHVAAAVARLLTMQRDDGGFAPWPSARDSSPHTSAYVTLVLARAQRAGFELPQDMLEKVDHYLLVELERWQSIRGPSLAHDIEAALLLRSLAPHRRPPAAAFTTLFERRARLPLFARANLLLALVYADHGEQREPRIDALVTELLAHVEETPATARVVSQSGLWVEYWDSDVRTSALVLEALHKAGYHRALVVKLARGLLDARDRGRWANTQENALALLALLDFTGHGKSAASNFRARFWLGNHLVAEREEEDRTSGFSHHHTPMAELFAAAPDPALILEHSGGRMYYRIGLDWVSTKLDRPAVAAGLELGRELRNAGGPLGDQPIERGSMLALDVTIVARETLDDLAIEIPLPGGLEAINLDLGPAGTQVIARQLSGARGRWVAEQELHRDRVVLLADHLERGTYTTTVFLRAIVAGDYRMPAAQAEMMYYPEIHARTTARRVVIR